MKTDIGWDVWKGRTIRYREGIEVRLVIAEKRSVAFAIAQALGDAAGRWVCFGRRRSSHGRRGHLVELSDPEEYTDMPWSARKWTMESFPSIRNHGVAFERCEGRGATIRSLSELLRSDKVTELVRVRSGP